MLFAHSLAEARLYLKINPCPQCRDKNEETPPSSVPLGIRIQIRQLSDPCPICGQPRESEFAVAIYDRGNLRETPINPADESSQIIDVGQWLTLARWFTEQAERQPRPVEARSLALQAAECLREALKFYDEEDNDLPPPTATFTDSTRRRFREAPQQFSRLRILSELRRLPVALD